MGERTLQDCRILIVEDEYMLADELRTELGEAGAVVLGPVGSLANALGLIGSEPTIHGAILDVNLQREMVFEVADRLTERGVPFIFTTGYEKSVIPQSYAHVARCEKPVDLEKVARAIGRAIHV